MKPTTLEEALSMVPTHWLLTAGVDVWQEGDVWHESGMMWRIEKANRDIGRKVNIPFAGRPLPQDVRESVARNLLMSDQRGYTMSNPLESWILAGKP